MTSIERAQALAKTALALMAERAVAPTPENFELFYAFAAGLNPAVSRVIGDMLAGRQAFTQNVLEDLRRRFFEKARIEAQVESFGDSVAGTLASMLAQLEEAGRSTVDYGRTLSAASGELSDQQSAGDVKRVVDALRKATTAMEERTKTLETRLQQSSREVSDLRKKLNDVRKESLTDPLTGIANRKAFDTDMERAISQARETGEPMSLLMCDIDRFKNFNDTFGHQTGDQVLRLVAACLNENVKGRDTAARYGGEEFAVIVRGAGLNAAKALADQIRIAVQAKKLVKKSTGDVLGQITISIGAAELLPGEDSAALIARADGGLYAAKADGRNCVWALPAETAPSVAA